MKLNVIPRSKIWLSISVVLMILSFVSIFTFGLKPSIEFTGGSLIEFTTEEMPAGSEVKSVIGSTGIDASVQVADESRYIARMPEIDQAQKDEILEALGAEFGEVEEFRFESIGPTIGKELQRKSMIAVFVLLFAIVGYVAWAFRKVSEPVASWKYGVLTIVAAAHDVIIPLGVFAALGAVWGYQIDTAFIAALLTIIGYSINDTIVVFDRTRENLIRQRRASLDEFAETVDTSVNQSIMRSINTSFTTILVLVAVFFFGGETLKPFILALIIGILSGAYSSIFVANPLLVLWQKGEK